MPVSINEVEVRPVVAGDSGDMFLSVVGQKTGVFKGEAQDDKHKGEIQILGWSWGLKVPTDVVTGGTSGKATIKQLSVLKQTDAASCALMSAAANNEVIKKAVLTVRKAGTVQQEYFKLTIEKGRITAYDVNAPGSADNPEMLESVTFSFQKIEIEYRQQDEGGQLKGSTMFSHSTDNV